jgi:Concanavalin A-like lectin/glucanases superfamily/Immunoglobulin I-set domain/NHL repeat
MFLRALRAIAAVACCIFGLRAWSQNCDPPPPGLVSWWAGEGNAADTLGLNNGRLVGGVTFTNGEVGQAFSLNGSSQYVDVPNNPTLNPALSLTLEAWVYPTQFIGSLPIMKKAGEGSAQQDGYALEIDGGNLLFAGDVGGNWFTAGMAPMTLNQWSHVAAVYDGTNAFMYINGVLVGSGSNVPGPITPSGNDLHIGHDPSNPSRYFSGLIDEAGLYTNALSASQVQAIYNAGSAGKCQAPTIWLQPQSQTVPAGANVSFSVTATGASPLSYQWLFNGTDLAPPTGTITTVAGGGSGGDGSAATNASLFEPRGVAVDAAGNLFIADQEHNTIRKVGLNGLISTVAGTGAGGFSGDGGQATAAVLQFPFDVAVDASGNLFIADFYNQRIRKVATNGIITTVAGSGGAGPGGGGYGGDGGAATNARLNEPESLALDAAGDLFIADYGNNRIRKVDTNGIITTVAGLGGGGFSGDGGPATNAGLSGPNGVTVDSFGNVFIGDYGNNRVRKVNPSGIITTVAGGGTNGLGDGGAATNATLSMPTGVAADANGNVFISDTGNNRVRELTAGGIITTFAGDGSPSFSGDGGPATNASINYPYDLTVDKSGNVFFVDMNNQRIRRVTLNAAPAFTIDDVTTNNAGDYTVIVTNTYGSVTSSVAVLTVNLPMCDPPPPGLVSWWAGEGNAADNFGLNNGTLVGGVTFTNGEVGQAFSLNGSSQYVDVPNSASLNPTASVTLEAWVFPKQFNLFGPVITKAGQGLGVNDGYTLEMSGAEMGFWVYVNGGWVGVNLAPIASNQWSHVAGVYDGTNVYLYVNGALAGTPVPAAGPIVSSGNDLQIGHDPSNPSRYFNGLIDEASVYSNALTAAQIQAIFLAGSAGKCGSFPPVITGNPQSETIYAGRTATFSAEASGTQPLSYQWLENSTNIPVSANPTAATASLVLTNANVGQSGNIYSVIITNAFGVTNSSSVALTVLGPGSCFPPPAGLVSWWPGERTGIDIMGTNNGTLVGGVTFGPGEVGQAFEFNGTSDYVSIPASPTLDVGQGPGLTIETWIQPADLSQRRPLVEWNADSPTVNIGVHFWISQGSPYGPGAGCLYANVQDTSGNLHYFASAAGILTTHQFQHVALTYDKASGTGIIYLNGVVVAQQNLGTFTPETSYPVFIGIRPAGDGAGTLFSGAMDEVSLYNRALTPAEIQEIYDAGSTGKCKEPVIVGQPQSQVGYWGSNVVLSVNSAGTAPLYYQWEYNNAPILGATNATLILGDLQFTNAGAYTVVISNLYGSMTSTPAILTVNPSGVSLALYSGLTIIGVPGLTYGIQYSTNLSNTNDWLGLANVTLSQTNELWFDLQPANLQVRYYRVVPGPISIP